MNEDHWQNFVPLVIFVVVLLLMFWWIVIRPATRRQREHRELIESLQEGDRIVTAGGIYGRIVKVGEEDIDAEVARGVIMTFDCRAVRRRQE